MADRYSEAGAFDRAAEIVDSERALHERLIARFAECDLPEASNRSRKTERVLAAIVKALRTEAAVARGENK
jgi:hypothetical protein